MNANSVRIIRLSEVIKKTGLSRSTIYTLIKEDNEFPKQIPLASRSMGFLESEVNAWIAYKAANRNA